MVALRGRKIAKVHYVRPEARYVSKNLQEYYLKESGGFWCIKAWRGFPNSLLQGRFTSFVEAEKHLITYLRKTDKFKRALYPGMEL